MKGLPERDILIQNGKDSKESLVKNKRWIFTIIIVTTFVAFKTLEVHYIQISQRSHGKVTVIGQLEGNSYVGY